MQERNFALSDEATDSIIAWTTYLNSHPEDVRFGDELHIPDDLAPGIDPAIDFLEKAFKIRQNEENLDKNRVAQLLEDLRSSYLPQEPEVVTEVITTIPLPITVDMVRLNPNRSTRSRSTKPIMRSRKGSFPSQLYKNRRR